MTSAETRPWKTLGAIEGATPHGRLCFLNTTPHLGKLQIFSPAQGLAIHRLNSTRLVLLPAAGFQKRQVELPVWQRETICTDHIRDVAAGRSVVGGPQ